MKYVAGKIKLLLIFASIFIFFPVLCFGQPGDTVTGEPKKPVIDFSTSKDSPPSPAGVPSPSPLPSATSPASDVFAGKTPQPFDFDEKKLGQVSIFSCGHRFQLTAYQEKPGELLIPLSSRETSIILDKFGTSARYDREREEVVFTREGKTMRMKINYGVVDFVGEEREIPVPARVIKGMVHISPNSFSRFIWGSFLYDDKKALYYLDPWLLDVSLETNDRGLTKVVARGTGPFRHRILKLRNPTRFVIDILNACLDGKARSIKHPVLGDIRFSQHDLKGEEGNIVRIVIPESEQFEIAMAQGPSENFVEAELRQRTQASQIVDLDVQKITGVEVVESDGRVEIVLETTGPVQMEWTRLLPPDDRFFVDIPGTLLPEKKKQFKTVSSFLPEVVIAQNEPMPNPRVRMVLPLEDPRKVTFQADKENPNKARIIISKDKIDALKAVRKGFFITYYPTGGLVICIDPGHGGSDPGAVNSKHNLLEKDVAFDISQRMRSLLIKEGWTVIMTRNSDRDVTYPGSPDYEELGARTSIANDLKARIFLSVHINASVRASVNGIATYWYKPEDQGLAGYIHQALVSVTGRPDLGLRRERFFLLRRSAMPAVLLEIGFISNDTEARLLKTPEFRQKAAEAVVQGLRAYAHANKLRVNK